MRKLLIFLAPLLVVTIAFLLLVLVLNRDDGKGALQVTSVPTSQIFLDGKYVGKTPLCLCELRQLLKAGEYVVKLVPTQSGFKEYEQKITLYQGVLSVVDRTFDVQGAASSGSFITLSPIKDQKSSELLVISFPAKAQVVLDSNPAGETPFLLKNVTPSDHEIKILKDGYKEKILKLKTIEGKRLETTTYLGIKPNLNVQETKPSFATAKSDEVLILDTPTGYLRVREKDSASSDQIATINPGDKYALIQEKEEWFEIKLKDGRTGWISSTYARRQ